MRPRDTRGFTLIEMLVGLLVTGFIASAMATLLVHNAKTNKAQQMFTDTQINARGVMEIIVTRLRSAGWDPVNAGIDTVNPDPTPGDGVSQLEILADLDEDGLTASEDEAILIRHVVDQVEWRRSPGAAFTIMASQISNDANGDGIIEPMFQLDDPLDPAVVTVQVTARSSAPDPRTGEFIRYTLRNEVALRKEM